MKTASRHRNFLIDGCAVLHVSVSISHWGKLPLQNGHFVDPMRSPNRGIMCLARLSLRVTYLAMAYGLFKHESNSDVVVF